MSYGKWLAVIVAVVLVLGASASFAVTEQDVTLTVTIRSLGVSVTPATYAFGVMNLNETKVSDTALVVKNEGNAAEDIGISVKDEDDKDEWTVAAAAGANVYALGSRLATNAGTFVAGDALTTTVQWCDGTKFAGGGNDMVGQATVNQWFQLQAPTGVTGANANAQHTITVEVSCRAAE